MLRRSEKDSNTEPVDQPLSRSTEGGEEVGRWPVFICYRQSDGASVAQWIYERPNGREIPDEQMGRPKLDVYWDRAAPAVGDWRTVHFPYLQRALRLSSSMPSALEYRARVYGWWKNVRRRELEDSLENELGVRMARNEELQETLREQQKPGVNEGRRKIFRGEADQRREVVQEIDQKAIEIKAELEALNEPEVERP